MAPAVAQSGPPFEGTMRLRSSEEPRAAWLRDDRARRRAQERGGQGPVAASAPGSGAGRTGFVSTNVPRRPARRPAGLRRATVGDPMVIAPSIQAAAGGAGISAADQASLRPPRPMAAAGPAVADPRRGTDRRRPARRKRPPAADPFEPLGIRLGAFLARPSVEMIGGYDTNPGRTRGGKGSAFATGATELQVQSDWQRHELVAVLRGSYTAYDKASSLDRPSVEARVAGRIDVSERTRILLEGRHLLSTDNPGSPDLPAGLRKLPIFTRVGASAGASHRFNRFEVALRTLFDRTEYRDSELTDGSIVSNKDRNYDQHGAQLRASYELTPGVKPFVEANVDRRSHDLDVDRSGVQRNSSGYAARAGTTFELTRLLTGEVAAGYLSRSYKDPALPRLSGAIFDASLVWVASGLTTVTLKGATTAAESTLAGVSGVLRREVTLQVDHAFRRWLVGIARFGFGHDDYQGSTREDKRYSVAASLAYKFSRSTQLRGELRHEWFRSTEPASDYTATIALLGLRWQP